jgi:ankyrin repeat protein
MLQTVCRTGSPELLRLIKEKSNGRHDAGKQSFADNESCLHLAVTSGNHDMVRFLLADYPTLAHQSTSSLQETPLFFVLSKLKD